MTHSQHLPDTGQATAPANASHAAHGTHAAHAAPPEPMRLYGPRLKQNPGELYREIRRLYGPVAPILLEGDIPAWFVTGYREVRQVCIDSQLFARDSRRWNVWDQVPADWPLMPYVGYQPSVMFTEGSEHRRRAGAISAALAGVDQFALRKQCEQVADGLIDGFAGRGSADLKADYAHRLPMTVVAKIYGLSAAEVPTLVHDLSRSLDSDAEDALQAYQRVAATMARLVESRRKRPGPDVPSRLMAAIPELGDEELVQDLLVVLAAAQQPTANWIGNTLRLMLTDVRFAVSLSGGRRSVGEALNEVLWEDTPTQNFLGRWAVRDTQLGGQYIRAGDLLVLGLAAANTDPQVRPDAYVGAAGNQAQMSFGHGEHGCPHPAPELAETIARAAVEVLLDRLPDVVLAVPPESLEWRESIWMRGLTALPVAFTPAYITTPE